MSVVLDDLKAGDEVIIHGTIDTKAGPSAWLVLDGATVGRVVRLPADVVATKTGRSPNYERSLLTPEEKLQRRNALQRKYREAKRENRKPEHRS